MTRSGGRTGSWPTSSTCGCCTWRPRPASVGRGGALRARLDAGATCDYATSRPRCHSVLWAPAYALVQELLGAKRDLDLPRAPSASSTRTPRGRDRIRRAELPHGPLPPKIAAVTCAPQPCSRSAAAPGPPTVDLVNARTGPGSEPPVDRASGVENARGPSCQVVPVETARFPHRFGRRKRRPHVPQASLLLMTIHDDRNRPE